MTKGVRRRSTGIIPLAGIIPEVNALPGVSNALKFTGKERDRETGLDYFEARH